MAEALSGTSFTKTKSAHINALRPIVTPSKRVASIDKLTRPAVVMNGNLLG